MASESFLFAGPYDTATPYYSRDGLEAYSKSDASSGKMRYESNSRPAEEPGVHSSCFLASCVAPTPLVVPNVARLLRSCGGTNNGASRAADNRARHRRPNA